MTTAARGDHKQQPWRTPTGQSVAPKLGPTVVVPVGDGGGVPVPRCNNDGQIVFESDGLRVGRFRSEPSQENFRFSGVPGEHIVVFQRGAVRIRRLGRASYLADSMTVHFLDPDQIYFRDGIDGESDWATWVGLDVPLVDRLLGQEGKGEGSRWRLQIAPLSPRSYLLHCELAAAIDEGRARRSLLSDASHLLLRRAISEARTFDGRRGDTRLEDDPLCERAREILGGDPSDRRSLREIASELGCSTSHLGRLFRRHIDTSPHQYRLQVRLRRALVALIEGASDLADLGLRSGFASHSHFTTTFRSAFGVTPSVFGRSSASDRLGALVTRLSDEEG